MNDLTSILASLREIAPPNTLVGLYLTQHWPSSDDAPTSPHYQAGFTPGELEMHSIISADTLEGLITKAQELFSQSHDRTPTDPKLPGHPAQPMPDAQPTER